jgi:protocatechuate 3,4-dioxygenase beta subunit
VSEHRLLPRDWNAHPPFLYKDYKSTVRRAPSKPLVPIPQTLSELSGPVFGHEAIGELDNDLTRNGITIGPPHGERIIVTGRVIDESQRPVCGALVEVWQTNAAGRYRHTIDQHDVPIDPNFFGAGRCLTDDQGCYRFTTVRPGAYPWRNHTNAWRPAHIHFSLFGVGIISRLVTQMYFPGDPLLCLDPVLNSVPDEAARRRLVADFSLDATQPEFALGYQFDIVLRGPDRTPMEA